VTMPKRTTRPRGRIQHIRLLLLGGLLRSLGDFATLAIGLLHRLDDTDGDGLSHVTDSETTKGRVFIVALNAHGLRRSELDDSGITRLDELRVRLHHFTRSSVDLLDQLAELAGNVCGVAIKHWRVAGADLTRVIEHDDLGVEGRGLLSGIILGVGTDISASDILDGNVLDVEANIVAGVALLQLLVVHFDGLDFSGDVGWGEGNDHASLDNTGFNSADGHGANTTNLVHILKWKTVGLVGRSCWGLNAIDSIEEGLALDRTGLGLTRPAFVPRHVRRLLKHVVTMPAGDRDESDLLGVEADFFDEVTCLFDNFIEAILRPLGGVHLVDGDDELTDTEGEGK